MSALPEPSGDLPGALEELRLGPRSRVPNREQQLRYLMLREQGVDHVTAARQAGTTGTRIKSLYRHNQQFRALCDEIAPIASDAYGERLQHEITDRAFDRKDPASPRFLQLEAEAHIPAYKHRRIHQSVVSGQLDVRAIPWINADRLDAFINDYPEKFAVVLEFMEYVKEPGSVS